MQQPRKEKSKTDTEVYPPSEDTFLLEDALGRDKGTPGLRIILEVGCGSGYITRYIKENYRNAFVIGTDINMSALKSTSQAMSSLPGESDVFLTNIFDNIKKDAVDMVVFNPPYIPSEEGVLETTGIDRSWAGGANGRALIDEFLEKARGVKILYLLVSRYNKVEEVADIMQESFDYEVVASKRIEGETLFVFRGVRRT